jgi:cobalt-zinc-cadmium efflux system membrane fusion protein
MQPYTAKMSIITLLFAALALATPVLAASGKDHDEHGHNEAPAKESHGEGKDAHAGHGHAAARDEHGHEEDGHAGHGHEAEDLDAFCKEHRLIEREDALCQAGLLAGLQPGQGLKVRLASPEVAAKAGIAVARPQRMSTAAGVLLTGRSEFNRNRLARLTALAGGVVRRAGGEIGQRVVKGEVLAEIASPEGAATRGQYGAAAARQTQAEAAFQREKELFAKGISSRLEYQQAEADYLAARSEAAQLREQLGGYGVSEQGGSQVRLRAPLAGVIVEKAVAVGDSVAPGSLLYTIADPESLWIELALPEARVEQAQVGAQIEARFDGLPGSLFAGRIVQVGAALDERTRTLKAVAEIKNPGGRLKAGMFGQVKLLTTAAGESMVVPVAAVQSIDKQSYVFVRREPDLFEVRRVETGAKERGFIAIPFGLAPEDEVVVAQGFSLKSEVLKARLGASCADH